MAVARAAVLRISLVRADLLRALQPLTRSGPARSTRDEEKVALARHCFTSRERGSPHADKRGRPGWPEHSGQERCESTRNDRQLASGARRFVGRARGSDELGRRRRATLLQQPSCDSPRRDGWMEALDRTNDRGRCATILVKARRERAERERRSRGAAAKPRRGGG